MQTKSNTFRIVLTGLMMCLVMVAVIFIRIPIPGTQGYVHLGDAMVLLSVLILGWKYGMVAAGVGSMLADITGGFAIWAPFSLVIKAVMAVILGIAAARASERSEQKGKAGLPVGPAGLIAAGVFMVAAYYLVECLLYGNWVAPVIGIPWNIAQYCIGMIIASVIAAALYRTPLRKYFTYSQKTVTNK